MLKEETKRKKIYNMFESMEHINIKNAVYGDKTRYKMIVKFEALKVADVEASTYLELLKKMCEHLTGAYINKVLTKYVKDNKIIINNKFCDVVTLEVVEYEK